MKQLRNYGIFVICKGDFKPMETYDCKENSHHCYVFEQRAGAEADS